MKLTTILVLPFAFALASSAQAQVPTFYDQGSVGFGYTQFPVGPYSGSFLSDGGIADPDAFPPGGSGASIGIRVNVAGVNYLLIAGGVQNTDATADVALIFLRSAAPFAPGPYPVDPIGYTALFAFIDDASSVVIPDQIDSTNWQAWVAGLVADHKIVSGTGSIVLTTVTDTIIEGAFAGIGGEFGGGIMVSFVNGHFFVDPEPLPVEATTWGSIKGLYR